MKLNFNEISRHSHEPESHEYKILQAAIQDLHKSGLLLRFNAECVAASDILQHKLAHLGLQSKLVECQLSIVNNDPAQGMVWNFVGFDNAGWAGYGALDTHVVVLTEGKNPYLIDLSIGYILGGDRPWVCEKLVSKEQTVIGRFNIGTHTCIYYPKKNLRLIGLHQKNILDRHTAEKKMLKTLNMLKIITLVLMLIVSLNFARGFYDFYQTYVNTYNNWGPAESTKKEQKTLDLAK